MTFPYQIMIAGSFGLAGMVLDGAGGFTSSSLPLFQPEYFTLALTFSKEAGLTREKQIKKTSCVETRGSAVQKETARDNS